MSYTNRSQRTGSKWNGMPVYRDDENNEFIYINQHPVDIKFNGNPRPEDEILRDIESTRRFTNTILNGK